MIPFEKLTYPTEGTRIKVDTSGNLIVPSDPIIPFIEGDGVGPDIWKATQVVIDAAVSRAYGGSKRIAWLRVHAGLSALELYAEDTVLPDDTVDAIRHFHVAIKGPLTTPVGGFSYVCLVCAKEQNGTDGKRPAKCSNCGSEFITPRFRSINVGLRQILDLYACMRPVRWFSGVPAPVKAPDKLDIVIFRENTEDVYAGIEFLSGSDEARQIQSLASKLSGKAIRDGSGIGIKPISREGTYRLVRKAIRYALENGRKSVTLVHKGNIMKFTEGAFRDWGYELYREEFADSLISEAEVYDQYDGEIPEGKILIKDRIADQMFQQILLRPSEYDVVATPNLNGDYLSDAAAAQVGGLGIAPGANIGDTIALFEATHGSVPKYTGQDKVNPSSLILSGALMLEHLGWREAAEFIVRGLEAAITARTVTYDLSRQMEGAEKVGTYAFGQAIIHHMG